MPSRLPLVHTIGLEPAFAAGLAHAGRGEFDVVCVEHSEIGRKQFIGVLVSDSDDCEGLTELVTRCSPRPVVVITRETDPGRWAQLAVSGVAGIARHSDPPEGILDVLRHSLDGNFVIPAGVVHHIAARVHNPSPGLLTSRDTRMMIMLARGATVAELAEAEGFAVRTMHRHLRRLYTSINVTGIDQARRTAIRWGLADEQV